MTYSDIIKVRGTIPQYSDKAGGAVLNSYPVIGTIISSVDENRSGTLKVRIAKWSGPDNQLGTYRVRYASPFAGQTIGTAGEDENGEFTTVPHSYGMWFTPPDAGTEVLCVFINGNPDQGYFLGCVPKPGLLHMTPALAGSEKVVPNPNESSSYGGAKRLPVAEINPDNPGQDLSPTFFDQPRPIHSYQALLLHRQGVVKDPIRGVIGSHAMRESPSAVFGISTPGRAIYSGGVDDAAAASGNEEDSKVQVTARRGGHTFVMDDGDHNGADQLIRIRTAQGHQITMSDDGDTLLILHKNGLSWIELGKEGTVDIYNTNSFNVRTCGDINLHAERDINMHAKRNINMYTDEAVKIEANTIFQLRAANSINIETEKSYTVKSADDILLTSGGITGILATKNVDVKGKEIHLNTSAPPSAPSIELLTKNSHSDTKNSEKGFINSPGLLKSITSRAPAHWPWPEGGKGCDAKCDIFAPPIEEIQPSPPAKKAMNAAPADPGPTTSPPSTSTVNNSQGVGNMPSGTVNAATSQVAAAVSPQVNQVRDSGGRCAGIVSNAAGNPTAIAGQFAHTPEQLEAANYLKPGAAAIASSIAKTTGNVQQALSPALFTGKNNVRNLSDLTGNSAVQVAAQVDLMRSGYQELVSSGLVNPQSSAGQTVGLVMAASQAGPKEVLDFAKSVGGSAGLTTGVAATAVGLSAIAGGVKTVDQMISGGNFAGQLADKVTGTLGDIAGFATQTVKSLASAAADVAQSLESAARKIFNSQVESIPKLKAGEPNNLIQVAQDAAKESASALSTTATASPQLSVGSVTGAIGAAATVAGIAGSGLAGPLNLISGTANLVTGITNQVTGAVVGINNAASAANAVYNTAINPSAINVGGESISAVSDLAATTTPQQALSTASALAGAFNIPGTDSLTNALDVATSVSSKLNSIMSVSGSDLKLPAISTQTLEGAQELFNQQLALAGNPAVAAVLPNPSASPPVPVNFNFMPNPAYDRYQKTNMEKEDAYFAMQKARPDPALIGTPEYDEQNAKFQEAKEKYLEAQIINDEALKEYTDSLNIPPQPPKVTPPRTVPGLPGGPVTFT